MREPPHTAESLFKCSLSESREQVASMLEAILDQETLPPNRLIELIAKGLEYERMVKSGKGLVITREAG